MFALVSVAWHLATSWRREHRWRRIALPASLLLAVVVICGTISTLNAYQARDERELNRTFATSPWTPGGDVPDDALYVSMNADYWHGQQFLSIWITPAGNASAILPPGLDRMLNPGESAVSPALAEEMAKHPELRARYPNSIVLREEGVADRGEFFAWTRPVNDEQLVSDSDRTILATSFYDDQPTPNLGRLTANDAIDWRKIVPFVSVFVYLPSILLMLLGMRSASGLREERFRLLRRLGASRRWQYRLAVLETVLVGLPVVLVVTGACWTISPRLDQIPFTRTRVFAGDMALKPWQAGTVLGIVCVLILILACMQVLLPGISPAWNRLRNSMVGKVCLNVARLLPLAGAIWISLLETQSRSSGAVVNYLIAIGITIAIMPSLVNQMGSMMSYGLSRSRHYAVEITGFRLQHHAADVMRPFSALATMAVILMITAAIVSYLNQGFVFVDHTESPSSAEVQAAIPQDRTVAILNQALPAALIVPIGTRQVAMDYGMVDLPVVGASCQSVAAFLNTDEALCTMQDPPTLGLFGDTFYQRDGLFDPTVPMDGETTSLLVVSHLSMEEVDAAVRKVLPVAAFPHLRVWTPESFAIKESPTDPWVQRGAIFAVILISAGVIASLIDTMIHRVRDRLLLVGIGANPRQGAGIELGSFAIPYLAALFAGIVVGVLQAYAMYRRTTFPWPVVDILQIVAVMLGIGVITAVLVAWFGAETKRSGAFIRVSPRQTRETES